MVCLTVHPRAYGERGCKVMRARNVIGSSPCIRGTRIDSSWLVVIATVHPRAYGERIFTVSLKCAAIGSSPCIRGTLRSRCTQHGACRFIPVHTGNAMNKSVPQGCSSVHPRAYGERRVQANDKVEPYGSSPCIRGTHIVDFFKWLDNRFIPVHTGNAQPSIHAQPD